jgi:hypothetical protein
MKTWSVRTEDGRGNEVRICGGLSEDQARDIVRFIRSRYEDRTVFRVKD